MTPHSPQEQGDVKKRRKNIEDLKFLEFFTAADNAEQQMVFADPQAVCERIVEYEKASGYQLVIKKGWGDARTYGCASHVDCSFKAKFGPRRGSVVLKKDISCLAHNDSPKITTAADGRPCRLKQRPRLKVIPAVHKVAIEEKGGKPKAGDVMKASANLEGFAATYNQSFL